MKRLTCTLGVLILLASLSLVATATDWPLSSQESDFWVDARDGWWSDVLILSDESGPSAVLSTLSPDALNWAFCDLPSYLAAQGTHRVAPTELGYQESLELEAEDLPGWEFASSLAYNVYDEPIHYTQWGGSFFMDPHSNPWANTVLDGIKTELANADGVSQDNIGVPPFIKGQGGFSSGEKAEFRSFLVNNLGSERLAFMGIDATSLDIAQYIRDRGYVNGNASALADPVFRAFVAYQYVSNLRIWQGMLDDIGIETMENKIIHGNQYGFWSPWDSNVYSVLLSQLHQVIEIEYVSYLDTLPPRIRDSLIYKLGLASGKQQKPVWIRGIVYDWSNGTSILQTNHLRLIAASAYANGAVRTLEHGQGTPNGHVNIPEAAAASLLQYYDWLDDYRFLFDRRQSTANVGLVYSVPTMMWRFFPATQHWNSDQVASLSGMADVLEREHIPYDVIIFGHPSVWSDEDLAEQMARYDLLILPDVDCLSTEQIEALEAFVADGNKILFTGSFGTHDENLEPAASSRTTTLLAHANVDKLTGTPARGYYQRAILQDGYADFERMMISYPVTGLLGDDLPLETDAPETVSVNGYTTPNGLFSFHFLNLDYDFGEDTLSPSGQFNVTLRLPESLRTDGLSVHYFSDDGTSQALAAELIGNTLSVTIPGVATHGVLCLGNLADVAADALAACEADLESSPWAARDSEIAQQMQAVRGSLQTGNWLDTLRACADLEDLIALSSPRVLFDFSHRQQSALSEEDASTINPAHPEWFLLQEMASHVTDQINDGPITADALREIDVFVIAAHGMSFSSDEIAAVEQFVREGGGVLFIGNGGTTLAPASVTRPFGLEYLAYSSLVAAEHLWDSVSFDIFEIVKHPITADVDSLQMNYASPMTVDSDWTVVASTAPEVWQERDGDDQPSPGEMLGPFPVVAYRPFGGGRIAAVCDDAPFRDWGSPSLVYNLIIWLAGGLGVSSSRSVSLGIIEKLFGIQNKGLTPNPFGDIGGILPLREDP